MGNARAREQEGEADMGPDITLEEAKYVIEAAINKANDLGIRQNVAVVDAGGNMKAFARMDDAWLGSIDIAMRKAKTARFFDMPTAEIGKMSQPGGTLYGIEFSNGGLITFGGGMPIKNNQGRIIGAIGVSGSTVPNDVQCAEAGANALTVQPMETTPRPSM